MGVVRAVRRRIVCYGDSNTYGYDPRAYLGGRHPRSARWTALLESAGWFPVNEGENGRCIPKQSQDAGILAHILRREEAELAVVMLGSNDLLRQAVPSAEACTERMGQFLSMLLEVIPPSCQILLTAPPPMKLGTWADHSEALLEESRRLAGCYEALARKLGVFFADAGAWNVDLSFDGVHFSEQGHRAFAEGMLKILEQIVDPVNRESGSPSLPRKPAVPPTESP